MFAKQDEINKKMLYALGELMKAQKLQMGMLNDLREYVDKREALNEQMYRTVIDLLTKVAKT